MKLFTQMKYTAVAALLALQLLASCGRTVETPPVPAIHLDFNGNVNNSGLWNVTVSSPKHLSYLLGVADSCLNLTATSHSRQPVTVEYPSSMSAADYRGMSFMVWIRAAPADPYEYTIFSQKNSSGEFGTEGWAIGKSQLGSWTWWFSDGITELVYRPTPQRQPVNNGEWHQIGFTVDYSACEARLYYDGTNVAIYCLSEMGSTQTVETPFYIGIDPLLPRQPADVFNGMVDEASVWSRTLSPRQIARLYAQHRQPKPTHLPKTIPDTLSFMSWNICLGGTKEGRYAGIERIIDIIRQSGVDAVALQEVYGSGEMIADALGFYYYQRNRGLAVASRFPLGKSYNILRRENAGAITIELPRKQQIIFCPVRLNYLPSQQAYITSGTASADTLTARELKTRGAEMRYILWDLQALISNSSNVPLVIAGDFNSGSHLDWTEAARNSHYGLAVDFPASRLLAGSGFIDACRALYPDETAYRGITAPINAGNSFSDRTDIVYYTGNKLRLKSYITISHYPAGFPSDHAAVAATFSFNDNEQ